MTKDELKAALASKGNKLAAKAIEIIESGKPLDDLKAVVEAGASDLFFERDPAHPRSRFHTRHVLDKCFESRMGIVAQERTETGSTATIGHIHSDGREAHFAYLLSKGFRPGENSYRGSLFRHILKSCFYGERKESAVRFSKILIEQGLVDVNHFAANDYAWTNHPEQLEVLIGLGTDPKAEGVIDCALNYVGCSPNGQYTHADRMDVVKELLAKGAVPKKDLNRAISWQAIRHQLEQEGMLETMAGFGVITVDAPEGYTRWKEDFAA